MIGDFEKHVNKANGQKSREIVRREKEDNGRWEASETKIWAWIENHQRKLEMNTERKGGN